MSVTRCSAHGGKLGRDNIYLLAGMERYEELDAFVDITPVRCYRILNTTSLN